VSEVPVKLTKRPLVTESAVGTAPPFPSGPGEPIRVTIDGREVEARSGQLIIQAADAAGIYIPRFCYHPRMKPVGMCRMCLVEVEGPRGPSLMPACYNPVADGMKIETQSERAAKAQEGVLEFLLVNHPLDCPVCDKGGECPLQDQTLTYGPGETRFVEEKRHWEKPISISDLVYLDRERCIQCGRCVRFADEVAGDPLIDCAERGDKTEVATFPGEPYSSYFSGNVVQICPVGALLAKPYRFRARPWDLQQVESTCTTCAVGCRAAIQSSSDEVTRLIGIDSDPVNWGWLCDKGRFAFSSASSSGRLTVPLIRKGNELVESSWGEAMARAAAGIAAARKVNPRQIALIGGARLANEDAYVWSKVARMVLGTDNIDCQLGDGIPADTILALPRATIDQASTAPLVITMSPDIKDELPVLYLRLRDGVREKGMQLVELTPARTGLSPYAAETAIYRPGELAQLAAALTAPGPVTGDVAGVTREQIEAVRAHIERAGQIGGPDGPSVVVILGRPSLADSQDSIVAAARIMAGIPGVAFLSGLRRGNVNGALDFGMAPGVLPGRIGIDEGRAWFEYHWGAPLPPFKGVGTAGILADAARGRIGALVLVGSDPLADFPDSNLGLRGLLGARFVVAVDTHLNESVRRADVVLPAAAWAERRGTFTNIEGRITWLSQLVTGRGVSWPDWMIASELAARLGVNLAFTRLEDIWAEIERVSPLHHGISYELVSGMRARDGVVVPADPEILERPAGTRPKALDPMADPGIASAELHKVAPTALLVSSVEMLPESGSDDRSGRIDYPLPPPFGAEGEGVPAVPSGLSLPPLPPPSGGPTGSGLRLVSRRTMWDGGTLVQAAPSLGGLAPDAAVRLNPAVLADMGVAHGEKVTVRSARGSVTVVALADSSVPAGSAVLPWNLPGARAADLIDSSLPVTEVTITVPNGGEG
jgi:NADH-quinone oxidoreductase subunit G